MQIQKEYYSLAWWVTISVALKLSRHLVGMCSCVVPTVQMRSPHGVVVSQHPLWSSAPSSELCAIGTRDMLKIHSPERPRHIDYKPEKVLFCIQRYSSLTFLVVLRIPSRDSALNLGFRDPHWTRILTETDWAISKQHLQHKREEKAGKGFYVRTGAAQ